jgi:hypothetical protein
MASTSPKVSKRIPADSQDAPSGAEQQPCPLFVPDKSTGANRHRKAGETPCDDCRLAANKARAANNQKNYIAIPHWPAEPVIKFMAHRTRNPNGYSETSPTKLTHLGPWVNEAIKSGVLTDVMAEKVADKLGLMPQDLWSDWNHVDYALMPEDRSGGPTMKTREEITAAAAARKAAADEEKKPSTPTRSEP